MTIHKILCAFGLALLSGGLMAESPSSATVVSVQGNVEFRRWGSTDEHPLEPGMLLTRGTTIHTLADSSATLRLPDGGRLGLNPNSEITLGSLVPKQGRRSTLQLVQGMVRWAVGRLSGKEAQDLDYELYTSSAVAAVKGTDWEAKTLEGGDLEVHTYSSDHEGVEVGDPSGRQHQLAGPGQAVWRKKDGSYLERQLSREEYEALTRYDGFDSPKPPKGLPDKPGEYQKGTPEKSPKGEAGLKAAEALLKGSALASLDPKAAEALAKLVAKGDLGLTGLDRLIRQSDENLENAAKLKSLVAALEGLEKGSGKRKDLEGAFQPDLLLNEILKSEGLSEKLLEKVETAAEKGAEDPAALAAAEKALKLDDKKVAELLHFLKAQDALLNDGAGGEAGGKRPEGDKSGLGAGSLQLLDALSLEPKTLKTLAEGLEKIDKELEDAGKLGGDAGKAARDKALQDLAGFSSKIADTLAAQTGLDAAVLKKDIENLVPEKTPPTGPKSPAGGEAPPKGGAPDLGFIQDIKEQIQDLKQDQRQQQQQEQRSRIMNQYTGNAWIDRNGYQVAESQVVQRPSADEVDLITTSQRKAGPDAGTTALINSYVFNQALPMNWASVVAVVPNNLNAPSNLDPVSGAPQFYLLNHTVSLASPGNGCVLCLAESSLGGPQLDDTTGLYGVPYQWSVTVNHQAPAIFQFNANGSAAYGSAVLQVAAQTQGNSWVFLYQSNLNGAVTNLFTAQVWLLDPAGDILGAPSIGSKLGGLDTLNLITPNTINELLVTPSSGGGHIDLLVPNASFVGSFP